ncbi:MAG: hypothetical protein NXI01_08835 [Gammaproteobacteria bacterium]|nr:hypothetical protein [Gammaproteobacteria bacterium]
MPLTLKLRTDYTERINEQLDKIPIESTEDFNLVSESLQKILNPGSGFVVPSKYNDRIFEIKDSLDCPEEHVAVEENFVEYQNIIRTRIVHKIEELKALNASQKESYVQNQQEERARGIAAREIMAQHEPPRPGSEAHTVSERQWHALMQYAYLADSSILDSEVNSAANYPQLRYVSRMCANGCPEPESYSAYEEFMTNIAEVGSQPNSIWQNFNAINPEPRVIEIARLGQRPYLRLISISDYGVTLRSAFFEDNSIPISQKVDLVMLALNISPTACPDDLSFSLTPSDHESSSSMELAQAIYDKFIEIRNEFDEAQRDAPGL